MSDMRHHPTLENLRNLKETLLIVTVLYFYGLAFALSFNKPTYGMDSPTVFLVMGTLFLLALLIEALLSWWNRLSFLVWLFLWCVSYGIIGFFVAPRILGPDVLLYVYVEPVIVVFLGGFAFGFGSLLAGSFFPVRVLPRERLQREMLRLPGWEIKEKGLQKTFAFQTFPEALNFVNRVGRIAVDMHHHPDVQTHKTSVTIRLTSRDEGGITQRDVNEARKIDAIV